MAYKVIWSKAAEASFLKTVDYILDRWSEREALKLIVRTEQLIGQISKHPHIFREYKASPSIRHGILHKNTTLFYKVLDSSRTIRIMLFWNNTRDPKTLKL